MRARLAFAAASILVSCAAPEDGGDEASVHAFTSQREALSGANQPVIDHGGAVLSASKTWAIYWGPPSAFPADLESGMASLLGGFNGSSYLGIAQQYMRGAAISTQYMGAVSDPSQPPQSPPNTQLLAAEVCKLFPAPEPYGVYVVFTSNTPKVNYCAWHNKASCNGVAIEVVYIPNQANLPGCSPYTVSNLHCNSHSDGTVTAADSVAHEFIESVTDPQINAWYDKNKAEVADKCEYQYASCVTLGNGSSWQIQSEWSNALGGCQQD